MRSEKEEKVKQKGNERMDDRDFFLSLCIYNILGICLYIPLFISNIHNRKVKTEYIFRSVFQHQGTRSRRVFTLMTPLFHGLVQHTQGKCSWIYHEIRQVISLSRTVLYSDSGKHETLQTHCTTVSVTAHKQELENAVWNGVCGLAKHSSRVRHPPKL